MRCRFYRDPWWLWSGPPRLHEQWSIAEDPKLCPWWWSKSQWRTSRLRVTTCSYGGCKGMVGKTWKYFTLLAPLNSSWSKSKCRQRAPTVKSERSNVGLLVTRVELFGSSWCWVFSLARAPDKHMKLQPMNTSTSIYINIRWKKKSVFRQQPHRRNGWNRPRQTCSCAWLCWQWHPSSWHSAGQPVEQWPKSGERLDRLRDHFGFKRGLGARTVIPYLMMSFIRSSSIVLRKFSLGSSIKGTTSSRILATLHIIMKSFCVCHDNTQWRP